MIDNTIHNLELIVSQLKGINNVRKLLTLILYLGYVVYRIAVGAGLLAVNIVLGVLTLFYACFYAYYLSLNRKVQAEKTLRVVDRLCRWARLVLCLVGGGVSVVGIITYAQDATMLNLLFAVVLPIFLILQVIFDVVYEYVCYCLRLLREGIEADITQIKETYARPIQAVEGVKDTIQGFQAVKSGVKNIVRSVFQRRSKGADALPAEGEENLALADSTQDTLAISDADTQGGDDDK